MQKTKKLPFILEFLNKERSNLTMVKFYTGLNIINISSLSIILYLHNINPLLNILALFISLSLTLNFINKMFESNQSLNIFSLSIYSFKELFQISTAFFITLFVAIFLLNVFFDIAFYLNLF